MYNVKRNVRYKTMNLLLGILLLVVSISLFSLLIYLFGKRDPLGNMPKLLFSDITTDEGTYLIRIVPMRNDELPGFMRLPLHMAANIKARFETSITHLLQKTVPDYINTDKAVLLRVVFFSGIIERLREANYPPLSFKEILITRTMDKATKKAREHIKLEEDLIPREIGPVLWSYFVISKAEELFALIDAEISGMTTTGEEFSEWLDTEDIQKMDTNRGYVRHIYVSIKNSIITEADILKSRMEDIEKEQVLILQKITQKAVDIGKEKLEYSDEDFEDEVLKIIKKYEGALTVYMAALNIRVISAILGALLPIDRAVTKQRVDDCMTILNEESGQFTTFLKIMDSAYGEQFFELTPEPPAEETPAAFSLNYPSYLLCALMRWYKKHWVMERATDIRDRLLVRFGTIDRQINELTKIAKDSSLYTEVPMKEGLAIIIFLDASGLTRMERVIEVAENEAGPKNK